MALHRRGFVRFCSDALFSASHSLSKSATNLSAWFEVSTGNKCFSSNGCLLPSLRTLFIQEKVNKERKPAFSLGFRRGVPSITHYFWPNAEKLLMWKTKKSNVNTTPEFKSTTQPRGMPASRKLRLWTKVPSIIYFHVIITEITFRRQGLWYIDTSAKMEGKKDVPW